MKYYVRQDSIVREIWGKSDTVLFIFAGASAEFALNKAVDWLYFTGRLPADPLGRLFSTVAYARKIIFLPYSKGITAIDSITAIHKAVEDKRGAKIPQWSYRDVLYMLIYYSVAAFELLERRLTGAEKDEIYDVFYRVGTRMDIEDLPENYSDWLLDRERHLENDLFYGEYTKDLYKQYRKHLGTIRYYLLLQIQQLICPPKVKSLLKLSANPFIPLALHGYKLSRHLQIDHLIKSLFFPPAYKEQIYALDQYP